MIALLLTVAAFAGVEAGASVGVAVAPETAGDGSETAATGSVWAGTEILEIVRGEAHLAYARYGGEQGVDALEVLNRAVDVRLLGGVGFPFFALPKMEIGGDLLLGPDVRISGITTRIYDVASTEVNLSVRPSVAVGPYIEIWRARAGLRAWADLPRNGQAGVSAIVGFRL